MFDFLKPTKRKAKVIEIKLGKNNKYILSIPGVSESDLNKFIPRLKNWLKDKHQTFLITNCDDIVLKKVK